MNKFFYAKLAWVNIRKNRQTYVPYVLTCIGTMAMFFMMHSISVNRGINEMRGSTSLQMILFFGLYNVLGLEKKHIAKILCYETLMTSGISFVLGLCSGAVLNKLMFSMLLKLLRMEVPLDASIDVSSFQITFLVFSLIFAATLITNLIHILVSNPLHLLKGGQVGEVEPKAKWVRAILGFASLGIGYGIALSVESPLQAINLFFIAVLFVIYGTSEIFTTGSIAILKVLRKNKRFYYRSQNFVAVSGMMYRMKQNAAGLANICILSTAVLVVVSTTVSLYVGTEDSLKTQFPMDITIGGEPSKEQVVVLDEVFDRTATEFSVEVTQQTNYWVRSTAATCQNGTFLIANSSTSMTDVCLIGLMSLDDYNRLENQTVTLAEDEVLIHRVEKSYGKDTVILDNQTLKVKEELDQIESINLAMRQLVDTYVLVVNDLNVIEGIPLGYELTVDVKNSDDEVIHFVNVFKQRIAESGLDISVYSRAQEREVYLGLNGGLFFLGIFLGTLFLMATGLIIYYKQISEGFDDQERFDIMQRVGMSKGEVQKTIRTQILLVFFLPLAFTILHVAVAFPIITKIFIILGITNQTLLIIATVITVIIFTLVYAVIFMLTARTYYKIVERP